MPSYSQAHLRYLRKIGAQPKRRIRGHFHTFLPSTLNAMKRGGVLKVSRCKQIEYRIGPKKWKKWAEYAPLFFK